MICSPAWQTLKQVTDHWEDRLTTQSGVVDELNGTNREQKREFDVNVSVTIVRLTLEQEMRRQIELDADREILGLKNK